MKGPKENIIIVKSDPSFEWERKQPKKKKGTAGKVIKKTLAMVLVAVLAFSGAAGGMFVYDEYIRDEKIPDGSVVIQQFSPSPVQTSKPADKTEEDSNASKDKSGVLSAGEVYDKVVQSTVLFTCETAAAAQPDTGLGGFGFGNPGLNPQQPQISAAISYGSGIIMSPDGYIMTNAHVVDGVTKIWITLFDGTKYEASLIGSDTNTDIAVVKIDASNLPAATFADSDSLRIGDGAYVVGNPLGIELAFSLTCGNISSVKREIAIEDTLMSLMQIDAAVNPGNSGGPLANDQGLIIGVINAKIVDEDVEGVGFAIPANTALSIASELITHGRVASRPMLGITVQSVSYDYARMYPDQAGITVTEVGAGSCAEKAGIKVDDKITHFNGIPVLCNAELNFQKEKCTIGDTVTVTVERGGESIELTVVLAGAAN